ncbi:MAG: flagellin [Candidatus Marinimicrobia bacterium]|jgi:flagellin|nr:flagellin [Candidatus Neomarinimicrobiota bacterium]MBT4947013.1 flagellin [Candidatus Neomarinimicrobiota bacterium]
MSMVINTNVGSISAQRHINTAVREQSEAMERLSSGKRINSARDDAAGLGISNRMTSQIRGLDQAVRNANDGISLIQTAEGALDQTTNILQRMRELSIQSANGTYNDSENRASLDAEFQQLLMEVDRIAETTKFNGQTLLDGKMEDVALQIGADSNQTVEFGIQDMSTKSLGMGSTSSDVIGAPIDFTANSTSIGFNDVSINGQSIVKPGGDEITTATSQDELITAINENVNGVTATLVAINEIAIDGDGNISADEEISITATMADGTTQTYTIRDASTKEEIATKLADASNGTLSVSVSDDNKLIISAEGVSSLSFADTTGAISSTAPNTASARLSLEADNGDPITIERGTTGSYNDVLALGFLESTTPGTVEGAGITASSTVWGTGDVSINGVIINEESIAGTAGSLLTKVDAINAASDDTGVRAEAFVTVELTGINLTAGTSTEKLSINGILTSGGSGTLAEIVDEINAKVSDTGITAILSGETIQLEGNTASLTIGYGEANTGSITYSAASIKTIQGTSGAAAGFSAGSSTFPGTATSEQIFGGLKLTSETGNPISIDISTGASGEEHGLISGNVTGSGIYGSSLNGLSVDTASNSQKSIDIIDRAITTVNAQRGELGAINNRLEYSIDNLASISQQTSAARSRIVDADFAMESAALSRAQVLQQAGTAMLSQANASPQQVMQLLQG